MVEVGSAVNVELVWNAIGEESGIDEARTIESYIMQGKAPRVTGSALRAKESYLETRWLAHPEWI